MFIQELEKAENRGYITIEEAKNFAHKYFETVVTPYATGFAQSEPVAGPSEERISEKN